MTEHKTSTAKPHPAISTNKTEPTKHANIPAAICAVMGEITTLSKSMKNKHGNYNYASVDDFLDAVRPLNAKHGLVIRQVEEDLSINDKWLHIKYRYFVANAVDGIELDYGCKSVATNGAMGSQAYGSAESYGLKNFLRSLLMISTGDLSVEEGEHKREQLTPKNSLDPKWSGPLVKGKLTAALAAYSKRIDECTDLNELLDMGSVVAVEAADVAKGYETDLTYNDIVEQAQHDAPGYLTGEGLPELFVPVNQRMDAALDRLGANGGDE